MAQGRVENNLLAKNWWRFFCFHLDFEPNRYGCIKFIVGGR